MAVDNFRNAATPTEPILLSWRRFQVVIFRAQTIDLHLKKNQIKHYVL